MKTLKINSKSLISSKYYQVLVQAIEGLNLPLSYTSKILKLKDKINSSKPHLGTIPDLLKPLEKEEIYKDILNEFINHNSMIEVDLS